MAHLKYETLLNYLENRLSAEERSEADAHLLGSCQQCERRLALLRAVLDSVASDRTVAPPAAILKQAVELSQGRHPQPKFWNRVVAVLSFDNRLQLSSAATRGTTRARQMLFTTEQVDIDLKIKPGREDHELLGQVLDIRQSTGFLPAFVSLQNKEGQQRATETDSLGQFAFHGVPSGTYDLVFDLDDQEIAVTGLEFQDE